MSGDQSLARKSARELVALVASRAVSPVEVLDAHLAVIARVNPKLNAVVTLATDAARQQARTLDGGARARPRRRNGNRRSTT
jgi:Asp-tRNA(Asn)/Glu-tRNA(Gln) amidotransferase A subunit family amidase